MMDISALYTTQSQPQKEAPKVSLSKDMEKTKEAVQDFESFFLTQMFEQMYSTIPVNETFGGGNGERIFRSLLLDEYGKMMTQSGGIGLTDKIMGQLLAQQNVKGEAL